MSNPEDSRNVVPTEVQKIVFYTQHYETIWVDVHTKYQLLIAS